MKDYFPDFPRTPLSKEHESVGPELIKAPEVLITLEAYEKLMHYIDLYPIEISGTGLVKLVEIDIPQYHFIIGKKRKEKQRVDSYTRFIIYDVFTVKTFNTGAHTDAQQGMKELFYKLIQEGRDTSDVKLWWHSHVDMGASWSGEDHDTIFNFNCDWMVSIVGNKKQEFMVRLDMYRPIRITLSKIPFPKFFIPKESSLREQIRKEIEELAEPDTLLTRASSKIKRKLSDE